MKQFLFILLLSMISSSFIKTVIEDETGTEEEDDNKDYNFNYGAIVVSDEQKMVCKKFIGIQDLIWDVKTKAKEFTTLGEEFVKNYGEIFSGLKKVGTSKMSSDINTLVGLLGSKFDLFINRRKTSFRLYGEYENKFEKFCDEVKEGKVGEWYKFESIYNDTTIETQVNSLAGYFYKRSDDKYDVLFITSSQEFSIPPIKVPKETIPEPTKTNTTSDDKKKKEEYDLIYPKEYSDEQNTAIQKWFELVTLKGLCTLLGIEI